MNNKSTENLIESGGSIEELFVPPLNLNSDSKQLSENRQSDQANSDSDHPKNSGQKRSQKSFLVEKSNLEESVIRASNPPVPAVRKFSLPPIASKRNGKDLKENNNQITRKQSIQSSDTIDVVNERQHQQKIEKKDSGSESDSEIRQVGSSNYNKRNKIELASFSKETRKRLKKQFVSAEVNEESTSFISYEEKHEKEDNSEHSTSNRSSTNTKASPKGEAAGVNNEALVPDPDDVPEVLAEPTAGEPNEESAKMKSKKREKKIKSAKKPKDKRKKRMSRSNEQSMEEIKPAEDEEEIQEAYDFKRVIGVWIHETSALRFDPLIRQPRVRVSFYNLNDGELLNKSNPLRNAVLNYEPTNVTFIQPILSNRCIFKESSQIECDWNNELLIINEDIRHIQKCHVIIFFEIVDILSTNRGFDSNASNGWYPICWAFLKPGDGKIFSNIDVRCSLQLHFYQRQRPKRGIIDEWKAQKRIKYPAFLTVTVGSYQPETTRSVSLSRPMSVLEEEITGDIYTCASDGDGDDPIEEQSQAAASTAEPNQTLSFRENSSRTEAKTLNLESRLPGQQCKHPNRVAYKHEVSSQSRSAAGRTQYGSMAAKFSLNGSLLAFHYTTYMRSNHEIIVLNVNNLQISHNLVGHLSIIYDLDWLSENVLASVSSDRTAIIWFLSETGFHMKVLPHPSFVYASKWLSRNEDQAFIATGGRDCVLRIWKISRDIDADIELCDELIQHDNYITSLASSRKSTKIYSSDWNGVLLEWSLKKNGKRKDVGPLYHLKRKIKIFPKSIARIEMHVKSNRIYVQCIDDPLIYAIEITSAVVIQTIKYADESSASLEIRNTFTVSPCGSLLFIKCPNQDQIKCVRVSNEEQIGQIRIPISLSTRKYSVTSLTFHPNKNILAYSIFGDTITSCMFLMYNESDSIKREHDIVNRYEDDLERDFHTLKDWHKNRSPGIGETVDGIKSIAIDSILNRIDDLFFMAIRSPQHDDTDQFKEMQKFLEKFHLESSEIVHEENQRSPNSNGKNKVSNKTEVLSTPSSSASGESRKGEKKNNNFFDKQNARASWQLQNTRKVASRSDDSISDSSHHTFEVDQPAKQQNLLKKSDEHELSNATYSVESDTSKRSNLTFEVLSTAKK